MIGDVHEFEKGEGCRGAGMDSLYCSLGGTRELCQGIRLPRA